MVRFKQVTAPDLSSLAVKCSESEYCTGTVVSVFQYGTGYCAIIYWAMGQ